MSKDKDQPAGTEPGDGEGCQPQGPASVVPVEVAHPWREDVALAVAQYLETNLSGWQSPSL